MRAFGLGLLVVLGWSSCGVSEAEVSRRVQAQGYSDVVLVAKGSGEFDFTAKKDGNPCTGHIAVSAHREDLKGTCVAAKPEPAKPTLARPQQDFFKGAYEACLANDAPRCRDLGKGLMQVERAHPEVGVPFLERGCELDDAAGCAELARVLREGEIVPADEARAEKLDEKGCRLEAFDACVAIARRFEKQHQPQPAIDVLTGPCTGGHGPSCELLGELTLRGPTPAAADAFFRQACTAGAGLGCVKQGERSSPGEAVAQYRKGCALDAGEGCNALGVALELGRGTARALPQALASFHRACELNLGAGCRNKGRLLAAGLGQKKDPVAAANFFYMGCQLGDAEACERAGDHARACELGLSTACPR
jgi:TPR repeat protein